MGRHSTHHKAGHWLAGPRLRMPSGARALKDTPRSAATLGSPDLGSLPARRRGQRLRGQPRTTLATQTPELRTLHPTNTPPINRSNRYRRQHPAGPLTGAVFGGLGPAPASLLVRPVGGGTRRPGFRLKAAVAELRAEHKQPVRLSLRSQVRASLSVYGSSPATWSERASAAA